MSPPINKSLRMPPELWAAIEAIAKENNRSTNGEITMLVRKYVEEEKL